MTHSLESNTVARTPGAIASVVGDGLWARSASPPHDVLAFGPFTLSLCERQLLKNGTAVALGGRGFQILSALLARAGELVRKQELMDLVWPDTYVEEGSLRYQMTGLRRLLGDGHGGTRYITTQVGVGYAFVAHVERQRARPSIRDAAALAPDGALAYGSVERERYRMTGAPALPKQLFGREEASRTVRHKLSSEGFCTIVGPAGVGKTALAVSIARELADQSDDEEIVFVDLGALEDEDGLREAIARALEITDPSEKGLIRHLMGTRTLLVLDNCEHVVDVAAPLAERIHAGAPSCRLLATSREALRVVGEHVYWLRPLGCPSVEEDGSLADVEHFPAVALFIDRVKAADGTFDCTDEDGPIVGSICRKLDGMPLAIELGARRVATHGFKNTIEQLAGGLSLNWRGSRTANSRHQSLQAALDWSYRLISSEEKRLLAFLSELPGPFPAGAIQSAMVSQTLDETTALSAFDALIAKSLIVVDRRLGDKQYRLLDVTRTYAREQVLH